MEHRLRGPAACFDRYLAGRFFPARSALAHLAVEKEQRRRVAVHHAQLLHQLIGIRLFFHLLRHEPLHQRVRGVIILLHRQRGQVVDACRDVALVLVGVFKRREGRGPIGLRRGNRRAHHTHPTIVHVVDQALRMATLFIRLHGHPLRKAFEADVLKITRHGCVEIRRKQLFIHLLVQGLLNLRAHHGISSWVGVLYLELKHGRAGVYCRK